MINLEKLSEELSFLYKDDKNLDFKNIKRVNNKISFTCLKHGETLQYIQSLKNHVACSKCNSEKRKEIKQQNFIEESTKIHFGKYDYSKVKYKSSEEEVCIICPIHGEFWQTPYCHMNMKYGCSKCGKDKLSELFRYDINKFIENCNKIYNNKYDYSLVNYKNLNDIIVVICPKHGRFEVTGNNHLYKNIGCKKCKKDENCNSLKFFLKQSKKLYNDKYDYSNINYVDGNTKIDILCKKHQEYFSCTPYQHIYDNKECPFCKIDNNINSKNKNRLVYDTKTMIYFCKYIHGEKYDYSKVNYIKSTECVDIICKKHGLFKQTPNNHINGKGCLKCNDSYGEQVIRNWLIKHNIVFEEQKRFDDCRYKKSLPFDFYIPSKNMCIEFNGEQHYREIDFWGGEESFNLRKLRDKIKMNYCLTNDIKLVIIRFDDDINDILSKENLYEK